MAGAVPRARALAALLAAAAGCGAPQATAQQPAPTPAPSPTASAVARADSAGLVPAGFGTLRQDDLSIKLSLEQVQVRLIPLDEGIIRLLSPDSYRALRDLAASRRREVDRLVSLHGLRDRRLWLVSFFGLAPEAQFSPLELTITAAGREFRPIEVLPLSAGFGEQRLQPRETQAALYLFDDGMDLSQALSVLFGRARSTDDWSAILRTIERERNVVRARAARALPSRPVAPTPPSP